MIVGQGSTAIAEAAPKVARELVGPDGLPISKDLLRREAHDAKVKAGLFGALNHYLRSLVNVQAPPAFRAQDPLTHHPWVYVAAATAARVASQAPFRVMHETEDQTSRRRREAVRKGASYWPRAGSGRRAWHRHLGIPISKRLMSKAAEVDLDHPLTDLFTKPNPLQDEAQLFQMTYLVLRLKGLVYWVLTGAEGDSLRPGETPSQIWPVSPDLMEPVLEHGNYGNLVGWKYRAPYWMPTSSGSGARIDALPHEVVAFRLPNPTDLLAGFSPLAPIAASIEIDMMFARHQRSLLANGAVPRCTLNYDPNIWTLQQVQDWAKEYQQQHGGPENRGRMAILEMGLALTPIALSPQAMEGTEVRRENRQEELAVMDTPPSVVGLSEFLNYATAQSQDFSYWDRTIIPLHRMVERAVDGSVCFGETDETFCAFDYSGIEALRAGLASKIETAEKLCSDRLHCPPSVAFEVVGLDVPDYPGRDVALVGPLNSKVEDVLSGALDVGPPAPKPEENDEDTDDEAPTAPPQPEAEEPPAKSRIVVARRRVFAKASRWKDFIKLEVKLEKRVRTQFRSWVLEGKAAVLKAFDAAARGKAPQIDLTAVVPELKALQDALTGKVRPTYVATLDATYKFTLQEIGVPVFEADDARIMKVLEDRQRKLAAASPVTVRSNLLQTLKDGMQAGETVQQLRVRVIQVFDVASGSGKTLTVARTETAGLMNGVRNEMFGLQGFDELEWTTAGDEVVRKSHQAFGEAGPKKLGFNYLELSGGSGKLAFPGDPSAPPKETVNCRCVHVPAG